MNRMGRKLKLSALDQKRFAKMHENPRYSNADICWAFEISKPTIKDYADRLGLPHRAPDRPVARTRDMTKWRASWTAHRERVAEEQYAELVNAEAREVIDAKWWRCPHCTGRSSSREGHELCVNRAAA